ncbi:hypothetical protein UNDYM_5787 [Undibacterium sp. YM2]|uniref:zinc ribbon domain-containing protein n=1 Tax=Undibacterium sp. YM2 TaxID=2058625 RepID=UPI001331EA65|nr:zinc ribbon domain-containing protein [Undibacterium sp. YM2]BBB70040.1 hypothetical protein UNDYM_5787 [Undibacterium sp. YM2]
MFSIFASSKLKCPQCDHNNIQDAIYCTHCGLMLSSPRHETILRHNRWLPKENEVAMYFGVRPLNSITKQDLHIPVSARAYILQEGRFVELQAGDYIGQDISSQLMGLQTDKAAEILLTRLNPFALLFSFEDLHTAEFLAIAAKFVISVKIADVPAFAKHFMAAPGVITCQQLQQLLEPMVRQIAIEFLGAQSLWDLQDNAQLRQQLDERLLSTLNLSIAEYGFVATQAVTREVRHDKLTDDREKISEKIGSMHLVIDGQRAKLEQSKLIDALYTNSEWQKIARQEEQIRLRYRHEEMRQQFGKDLGWLYMQGQAEDAKKRLSRAKLRQDENERLQTIRARELELYGRIADAATRKHALERGAADTIKELEHGLKQKSEHRQNEADQWLHIRTMARIKMRSESEITQLQGKEAAQLMQQKIQHQLKKFQLEHEFAQANLIADQEQQKAQTELLRHKQNQLARREQELEEEEQKNRLILISIEAEAKAREFQRIQVWEEELQQQRTRALQREDSISDVDTAFKLSQVQEKINGIKRNDSQADAMAQHEKLLTTLKAHALFEQQTQQQQHQARLAEVEIETLRQQLRQQEDERRWKKELQQAEAERADKFARLSLEREQRQAEQAHDALLARIAIERMNAIANFSETGKIATADPANAIALAEIVKVQAQASLTAEQILAMQAGSSEHAAHAMSALVSAQQGMSWEQAVKMLQERIHDERGQREAEQQRRHEIDLSMAQNLGSRVAQSGQAGRK